MDDITKIFHTLSISILIIGLILVAFGTLIKPVNEASINLIITGFSIIGASILFIMCINYSKTFLNENYKFKSYLDFFHFIINTSPYLITISAVTWLIFMFSNNHTALVSSTISPLFYTYFFIVYICLIVQSVGIIQMPIEESFSSSTSSSTSILWNIILLFAILNIFSNVTLDLILTNYITQG